jgi:hypothetical protein
MFILGVAIYLTCFGLIIGVLGGSISYFINVPSLLMIVIPLTGTLAATRSFKVFYGGLKAVILPNQPLSEEVRGQAASLFRLLSKVTALVMGLDILVSLMIILMNFNWEDPNTINMLGINIAYSLVVMAYAFLLIAAVFEPVVFNMKKRRGN